MRNREAAGWKKLSRKAQKEVLDLAPPGGFVSTARIRDRAEKLAARDSKLAAELKGFGDRNSSNF